MRARGNEMTCEEMEATAMIRSDLAERSRSWKPWPWIGQQGCISFAHFRQLLALYSLDSTEFKEQGELSAEQARKVLRRFADSGYYLYRVFHVREPGWLWLTRKGLQAAGLSLRYYEPSIGSLPHLYNVNKVRLHLERSRPGDIWKSERELRAEQGARTKGSHFTHLPDAELSTGQGTVVVEVVTARPAQRFQQTLMEFAADERYSAIWYFATDGLCPSIATAFGTLPSDRRNRCVLYTLEGQEYDV